MCISSEARLNLGSAHQLFHKISTHSLTHFMRLMNACSLYLFKKEKCWLVTVDSLNSRTVFYFFNAVEPLNLHKRLMCIINESLEEKR
jgi:hypothetical protein